MMTTEQKIKAAVKMTDEEFNQFLQDAKERLDRIPTGPRRQQEIKEIVLDFDTTYGSEMDVRNNFNAPIGFLELRGLVEKLLEELGYNNKSKASIGSPGPNGFK